MNKKNKLIIFIFLFGVFFVRANFVFALDASGKQLFGLFQQIYNTLLSVVAILSAITVAGGGIYYITSLSRGSWTDEGKEWIKAGITGLIIAMCAYLIAYTINPQIVLFDFIKIAANNLANGGASGLNPTGADIQDYSEIPIGTLSEKLLTGTDNCYDFDENGDPISGDTIKDDNGQQFLPPTNMNHDRVDCYLKLADAAEKKALLAENLASKIHELMEQCSCAQYGDCKQPCKQTDFNGCVAMAGVCYGACSDSNTKGAGCTLSDNVNTFLSVQNTGDTSLTCCPQNMQDELRGYLKQHGDGKEKKVTPINLAITKECPTDSSVASFITKDYYGLDEFYTTKGASSIADKVEKKTKVDKKEVKYIDLGTCPTCMENCNCDSTDQACLGNQTACNQRKEQCLEKDRPTCLAKTEWGKLNLIEQSMYLNLKLTQIQTKIKADEDALKSAQDELNKCPLARSYIDFKQIFEQTNSDQYLLNLHKTLSNDNSGDVEIGKYCNGYNYGNSKCYGTCSEQCPITKDTVDCYGNCDGNCKETDTNCLTAQKVCSDKCFMDRSCLDKNPEVQDFKSCISTCKSGCVTLCSAKYIEGSEEDKLCKAQCTQDSSCLLPDSKILDKPDPTKPTAGNLDNLSNCVLDPVKLAMCGDKTDDTGYLNSCIDNSYLCKSGSSENAGYNDCLIKPKEGIPVTDISASGDTNSSDMSPSTYSGSFLFQNKNLQRCPDPEEITHIGWFGSNGKCKDLYPQIQKCPTNSRCPNCPCDTTEKILSLTYSTEDEDFPGPVDVCHNGKENYNPQCTVNTISVSGRTDDSTTTPTALPDYQIVGPTCNQPAFNDDPLTFYCRQDWWNSKETQRAKPIGGTGGTMTCGRQDEIPVGTMVSDATVWANNFLTMAKELSDTQEQMISFMKKIGTAKKYCECDSKYEGTGNPVCRDCCLYTPPKMVEDPGAIGGMKLEKEHCDPTPSCLGNSCQQMINWLIDVSNYHSDIKKDYWNLVPNSIDDARSDVLKELVYSRQKTDNCSINQNINGSAMNKMFSCQRVLDDIIPKITSNKNEMTLTETQQTILNYCYGQTAGKVYLQGKDVLDNWFCCENAQPAKSNFQKDFNTVIQNGASFY